jgi:peptidoglycan-associated lipoprotein
MMRRTGWSMLILLLSAACHKNPAPVARPLPPPPPGVASTIPKTPAPPQPVAEPTLVPPEPVRDDAIKSASLDDLNKSSPLKPVFFEYDSSDLSAEAVAALNENAGVLKRFSTWAVTVEGHCDERGSAEYNLALGERRAVAARTYLVSLGIGADRLRTVSYGKEFPFDPGRDESAFSKNRRAHFVITGR